MKGALVSVVWGTEAMPEIGRRTGSDGAFQVALPAGTYRLQAVHGGFTSEVTVKGGLDDEIVIRLEIE